MRLNESYFSLNSLFRVQCRIDLTPKECQFLAKGLKYAVDKFNLLPIKKRRDVTLNNNYSNQYDYKLVGYAINLYIDYGSLNKFNPRISLSTYQKDKIIKDLAEEFKP